jgi:hypothetical protein
VPGLGGWGGGYTDYPQGGWGGSDYRTIHTKGPVTIKIRPR